MLNRKRDLFSILIVCSVAILAGKAGSARGQEMQVSDAWQAMKSGDAVVLMRHALAPGMGDPPEFDLEHCSTQRNLSDAGRVQARAIGDMFRANGIAEAMILTSQWCRCMETARLLNLGNPEPAAMLNSFFQDRQKEHGQTLALSESLKTWLRSNEEVRVLVTHQVNISSLTGQFVSSGEMLIVTMENDELEVLAKVSSK